MRYEYTDASEKQREEVVLVSTADDLAVADSLSGGRDSLPETSRQIAVPSFLRMHCWLILSGVASEAFYLFYLLRCFPLLHHEYDLVDLGYLTNYAQSGFLAYLLCFTLLFVLFILALRESLTRRGQATFWLVLGFGALFALTCVFVYPLNAIDIYGYLAEGVELMRYHANPLVVPATTFASDPLISVANSFVSTSAPYGSLAILLDSWPLLLTGSSLLAYLLVLKCFFSLCLVACGLLLYDLLQKVRLMLAVPAMLVLLWNPYVLLEAVANGHNDILMLLLILLAFYFVTEEHPALAFLCILLSAFVKYSSLPLLPLFVLYSLRQQENLREMLFYLLRVLLLIVTVVPILLLSFWAGPQSLASVVSLMQDRLYSFPMLLNELLRIPVEQGQLAGYVLFACCYLFALWLVLRRTEGLFLASFVTIFALLAFASSYVQAWYLLWPCALALLVPRSRMYQAAISLSFAATLVELVHAYIWPWGAYQNASMYAFVNGIVYLILFCPALLHFALDALESMRAKLR